MRTPWALLAILTVACAAPSLPDLPGQPPPPPASGGAMRLLFVGNSLTYVHDVPGLVRRLASAAGKPEPTITVRASPDYGLEDHWREGWVAKALREGHYDRLIMQQGPSTLAASKADLEEWAGRFATEAVRHGTTPALYGVWAPAEGNLAAAIANYRDAAVTIGAASYPVGLAWQAARQARPTLPLYGPDGFHASEHGALLAAMVITGLVFDVAPEAMPNLFDGRITTEEMVVLRDAARTAIREGRR